LYQSKVDTFRIGSSELKILKETYGLEKNVDIMLRDAENYFNIQKYSQADSIAKQIMKFDPFNMACMPLYVNILVELGRKSELYNLANDLVTNDPKSALGWYAVGCYYYSTQKYEQARKYFTKSTQIDGKFVPSWIALGHSYAFTDETDFAMNAYRMGGKLYPGSHIPPLCIGIECIKTGTFQLAESTLALVGEICNTDPVLYNEYGVIQYRMGNYQNAIKYFQNVVKLSPEEEFQVTSSKSLETAHFNLGHAYRKLEMFDEAIKHYEIADKISHDGSVDGSLGFCYHLKGDFQKAIEYYHKGLAMNPEDAFINDMIPKALSLYANK
jgi:anaphase-promoting complex subunit 6